MSTPDPRWPISRNNYEIIFYCSEMNTKAPNTNTMFLNSISNPTEIKIYRNAANIGKLWGKSALEYCDGQLLSLVIGWINKQFLRVLRVNDARVPIIKNN